MHGLFSVSFLMLLYHACDFVPLASRIACCGQQLREEPIRQFAQA